MKKHEKQAKKNEASLEPEIKKAQSEATEAIETSQEIENQRIEKLQEELQQMEEIAKRMLSDFQNYKRRNEEEKQQFIKFANATLLLELITIIENFSRATRNIPKDLETNEWVQGILKIQKQMETLLKQQGLEPIPTIGQKLDPYKHEALLHGPGEKDTVIEELEKGYMIADRVLKPAKVKVGSGESS